MSKYRKSASVNDSFAIKSPSDPPILHHPHGTVWQTRSKSASVGRKSRKSATVKNTFSVKSPSDPPILRRQSSRLSGEQGNIPPSSPPPSTLKRGSAHQHSSFDKESSGGPSYSKPGINKSPLHADSHSQSQPSEAELSLANTATSKEGSSFDDSVVPNNTARFQRG